MKQKVLQQEVLLKRMQKLTADQLLLSNELEQSIPPKDLLESLQNELVELRKNTLALEQQMGKLIKDITIVESKKNPCGNIIIR